MNKLEDVNNQGSIISQTLKLMLERFKGFYKKLKDLEDEQ